MVNKTVVDYLNNISYKEDTSYVPSLFALQFINFIKLVNGDSQEEHKTPIIHYKMLDKLVNPKKDIINLLFRGSAKTTVFAEYMILYLAIYQELPKLKNIDLGIYVSDSIENGVKNMRKNLEYRWDNSEFLKQFIPNTRFTDIRWEFTNIEGKTTIFKGYGAATGVRGAKEMGKRPMLALLDDLLSDEDAKSDTVISNIESTVYKAIEHALDPNKRLVVWNGTPFNAKDPLYKAVESGAWEVNVFPVCEEFPCTEEEFKGAWEDRFSYSTVKARYDKALQVGKIDSFNQELMLRIMSDEDRLITDSDIRWYKRETLLENKDLYNFYITTDFATSEKTSRDFSVISVWAYNSNGDWFYVDGICKRQTMDKNINELFRLAQMYKPQQVGIEVSGQQGGFISWIQEEMMRRNIWFTLASDNNKSDPGIRPNTNKMVRFNVVVPWFKMHKIFFPNELKKDSTLVECMDELTLASPQGFKSKHDDFCFTGNTQILLHDGSLKKIKDIKENDLVMTLALDTIAMPACSAIMTGTKEVKDYFFSNGSVISVTENHPILSTLGWIQVKDITPETKIIWSSICKLNSMDISGLNVNQGIINQVVTSMVNEDGYINMYGKKLMEINLKDLLYTIKMKIKTITLLKIYAYCQEVIIKNCMDFKETWNNKKFSLKILGLRQQNGINLMKVGHGIKNIMKKLKNLYIKKDLQGNALSAENQYNLTLNSKESFALQNVLIQTKQQTQQNSNFLNVNGVIQNSCGTDGNEVVLRNAEIVYLVKKDNLRYENVYNFEVKSSHNYVLANGIIAHNCDTISMLASLQPWKPSVEANIKKKDNNSPIWEFDIPIDEPSNLHSYII
jgi:predicted phage terminase large subunit-like protein